MRTFKPIAGLVLVLAFCAIGVASASAAETLWPWLPGSAKETFTGKMTKSIWQIDGGIGFTCIKSLILLTFNSASSELLENVAKLALVLLHLEGCRLFNVPLNTLGDAKEVILIHLEVHNCMIKSGDFGLLFKPLPVQIEGPGISMLLEGSFVARIKPLVGDKKHYELEIQQLNGLPAIEKCEGGEKETLLVSANGGAFQELGIEIEGGLLLFDGTLDKEGEEMMEKG